MIRLDTISQTESRTSIYEMIAGTRVSSFASRGGRAPNAFENTFSTLLTSLYCLATAGRGRCYCRNTLFNYRRTGL